MPVRALFAALVLLAAGPAAALCTGPSLMDRLSSADRSALRAAADATPHGEGLFWTATRGQARLTLIGTMHIHDARLAPIRQAARPFVASADRLLVEMTPEEERAVQRAFVEQPERIMIVDGPTLPELLEEEAWETVAAAAEARGLPSVVAAKLQPWYLSLTLAAPPCAMPEIREGRRGLDHLLMEDAEAAGVPLVALEPWDTLFGLFDRDDMRTQLEMLHLGAVPADLQSETFVAMLDGYFDGRISEIWELSRVSARMVPGLEPERADEMFAQMSALLLEDRNRAWIGVIEAQGAGHTVVAAGAAHLPGETGLLSLLEARGWAVERLDPAAAN